MGKLARDGIHPEGTPFGQWCDAAWSVWMDYLLLATQESAENVEGLWDDLTRVRPDARAGAAGQRGSLDIPPWRAEGRRPTPEEVAAWSSSPAAQRGQDQLLEMTGYHRPGSTTRTAGGGE